MSELREPTPIVTLRDAALSTSDRILWSGMNFSLYPGEFVAILGGNGTGKTSLLQALLGMRALSAGSVSVLGGDPKHARGSIGYVPQQRLADDGVPLRGRDLVALGFDGHRFGTGFLNRRRKARVDELLGWVGASSWAKRPVWRLSGGEQQRLRIAQALASSPRALLCDEPLQSLDPTHQAGVSALINRARRQYGVGVLFVTHDINPILNYVDRVLYLGGGSFRVGTPDEVLKSEVLSRLYGSPIEVIRSGGRILVLGAPDTLGAHDHEPDDVVDAGGGTRMVAL